MKLLQRLLKDLIPSNHSKIYGKFIYDLCKNNYDIISLSEYRKLSLYHVDSKIVGLRHDVDIHNVKGNKMFFQIEKKFGAKASYYFREKTALSHREFIKELLYNDFEVGYHYEEAADFAKSNKVRTREDLFKHKKEIQSNFVKNLENFRIQFNPKLVSIASHGDWINRKLGFSNNEFIDYELLIKTCLDFEVYDEKSFPINQYNMTDTKINPNSWDYELIKNYKYFKVLTHERDWHTDPFCNTKENLVRLIETIRYAF